MEIRFSEDRDIPEIVNLLKMSLGEALMPKSETYWRWKHLSNPFGRSPVLVCFDRGELVGVRAFMRWTWSSGERSYSAVRAVDTATRPSHQGKGIFRRLTMELVRRCELEGDDFVFNTPNELSKPGYLKMGWSELGRSTVGISVQKPFSILSSFFSAAKNESYEIPDPELQRLLGHPGLPVLINSCRYAARNTIITNWSTQYFAWRYGAVPIANYLAIGEDIGTVLKSLLVGRIKRTRIGRELRIVDCLLSEGNTGKELRRLLLRKAKELDVDYISWAGRMVPFWGIKFPIGPIVTVRPLKITEIPLMKGYGRWEPSLGDLELF